MANKTNNYDEGYKWWVLVIVVIGSFMSVLDSSGMNIALPNFMVAFGINMEQVEWISTAYMLAFAIFILFATWVKNVLGLKQTFLWGVFFFILGSFLCSFSWSLDSLIFFRIIQAIGGGAITPLGVTMISEVFPKEERGFALGMWGAGTTIAPAVGPTMFGYMIDHVGWRALFYINVPIGVLLLFWGITVLKPSEGNPAYFKQFDFIGFFFFTIFISTLLVILQKGQERGWTSNYIMRLVVASYFSFFAFIITEFMVKTPIMDLAIFKNYNFSISNIVGITRSVALVGSGYLMSMYFQDIMGFSATTAGLMVIPQAIALSLTMPIAGRLSDLVGAKPPLIIGTIITAVSLYYFRYLSASLDLSFIIADLLARGCGIGLMMASLTTSAINALEPEQINMGSGILNLIIRVGSSFSTAIMGVIVENRTDLHMTNYVGKIAYNSPIWNEELQKIKTYAIYNGASFYNATIAGKGAMIGDIKKWAAINAYDDAFIVAAFFVATSIVPALLIKNIIYRRQKSVSAQTATAKLEEPD